MELRDFLKIFYQERYLYVLVVAFFLLLALGFVTYEKQSYKANLLLTIGRTESAPTTDYTYDNFYRLQADERFADTLVRLLGTPRVTEDIFREASIESGEQAGYFTARRLSSQIVEVTFEDQSRETLPGLSAGLVKVLTSYTDNLNVEAIKKENWFRVIASEPVITDARTPKPLVFGLAVFAGVFVGFWLILLRYYLYGSKIHAHRD
jgi:capsular polysaccharide biosynthesis protein